MNPKQATKISKFLSLVLRHQPESIGITLDEAGWTDVNTLLAASARNNMTITESDLREVVAGSDKQRFAFSDDGLRIRANQGHSVEVELGYEPATPPEILYRGTVDRYIESIRRQGLIKGNRHHVHLSPNVQTAEKVGQRRGSPVVITIQAGRMLRDGHTFFVSTNGVWLTDHVPAEYLELP